MISKNKKSTSYIETKPLSFHELQLCLKAGYKVEEIYGKLEQSSKIALFALWMKNSRTSEIFLRLKGRKLER